MLSLHVLRNLHSLIKYQNHLFQATFLGTIKYEMNQLRKYNEHVIQTYEISIATKRYRSKFY